MMERLVVADRADDIVETLSAGFSGRVEWRRIAASPGNCSFWMSHPLDGPWSPY